MKRYTSRFLKSVALLYLGFPFFYILLCALLFDIPLQSCLRVLLSPFYYLLSILAVTVGYALWEVRRWGWYAFVVTNVLIAYENAVLVNEYGETHHKLLSFLASLAFLLVVSYRVGKEIRVPYFFPKIRWWESNPRYRLSVPAKISRVGNELEGQILDLSLGGCFLKIRGDVAQDEYVTLNFQVFGFDVQCQGVVVWRTQSTVTHPKGVGVKFTQLNRPQRRVLRQVNQRLRKIAALYRSSRYLLNQEEFLKRLQEIESQPPSRRRMTG